MINENITLRHWRGDTGALTWELRETKEKDYNLGITKPGNKVPMWRNIGNWKQAMSFVDDLERCLTSGNKETLKLNVKLESSLPRQRPVVGKDTISLDEDHLQQHNLK